MPKSLIEYAYEFVSSQKEPVSFQDIWNYVKREAGLSEEDANTRVARFYTNIILDGRFVTLGENMWDLRARHTFDKVHIDMKDVYSDVEASDHDIEEDDEEDELYEDSEGEDKDSLYSDEEDVAQ